MKIQPPPFMRSYQSNETAEPQQQPPIEEKSIKGDSSSTDNPATNNQMSGQADIVFFLKPQAAVSQAKSLDDDNLVMKPMPPIQEFTEEEKSKFIPMCNQDEFFVESTEIKQSLILEEVSPTVEIPEEVDKPLEEYKEVGQDKLFEFLPPTKDNQHHATFILHHFEDPFLHNECVPDYNVHRFLD